MSRREKPKEEKATEKKKPIKIVPLGTGLVFMLIGAICLVYFFISNSSTQPTYATMTVAFFGFGLTAFDKSGIFER